MWRAALVRLHRWVGLAIAAFLVVAGLTGSVIAFNHELDAWLNPELFGSATDGAPLDPIDIATRVQAQRTDARVTYVPLSVEPGHSLVLGLTRHADAEYLELFVDPVTGHTIGERQWGACCVEPAQLVPFIYRLHYTLHLPGVWGLWVMGGLGLIWAVDCIVGFCLTLPRGRTNRSGGGRASFWQRWKPAWRIKTHANVFRVNFDVHRALGLWFWIVLFTLAISGVYLSLPFEVFRPAVSTVVELTPSPFDPRRATMAVEPAVSYAEITRQARDEGARRGWAAPFDVFHSPEFNLYGVGFGDHHAAGMGVPYLYFDASTGRVTGEAVPGEGPAGDLFLQWLFPLHSGRAAGMVGRALVALSGIAVAVLSVTGVVIWLRKRGAPSVWRRARESSADPGRRYEVLSSATATISRVSASRSRRSSTSPGE